MNYDSDRYISWQDAIDKLPEVRTWDDWGEIFLDVPTWAPLVREICRRAGIPCDTIVAGYPGSNAVFIVNRKTVQTRAVVKIYAPLCREDYDFEREIHLLLEPRPALGAPRLLAHGRLEAASVWPYVVLAYIPGEPIREVRDRLSDDDVTRIARGLGHRIRVLHTIQPASLHSLDVTRQGWDRYVASSSARCTAQLRRRTKLPQSVISKLPAFIADVLAEQPDPELVLVSGDITEDHVMLEQTAEGWCISGVIDFADARVAPREYEWPALWFSALDCDYAALETLMAAYDPSQALDRAFQRRAMAYTLLHEFGAHIIAEVIPPRLAAEIDSIRDLQAVLWAETDT